MRKPRGAVPSPSRGEEKGLSLNLASSDSGTAPSLRSGTVPVALAFALASALAACATLDSEGPVDAEAVYRARCAMCHPAWDPTDFTPEEWPRYVRKYAPRAGLTQAERVSVLEYLVREAAKR